MTPDMNKAEKWLWRGNFFAILMILLLPTILFPPAMLLWALSGAGALVCFWTQARYMPKERQ